MKVSELEKLDFNTAISILQEENNDITDIEALKDFIKYNIDRDNFMLSLFLLNSIHNSNTPYFDTYYYKYDYSLGTYDTPHELNTIQDLKQFCKEK